MSATSQPAWLSGEEQAAWRAISMLMLRLPRPLDAQLQHDSGLTLFEYFVLSWLSMAPKWRLRMTDLAECANGSLSRLSNVAKRLEQRGLLRRDPDPEDGRATVATLTDRGWEAVEAAAPGHVAAVRRLVIEPLSATQLRQLASIGRRVGAALDCPPDAEGC